MNRKLVRDLAIIVFISMLAIAAFNAFQELAGAEEGFDLPRMLGLEGAEEEHLHLEGPPTTDVEGPFFETSNPPVSMDIDLRSLPQTGPETKTLIREMGQLPTIDDSTGPDPVIQSDEGVGNRPLAEPLAAAPAPLTSFKGLDLNNWGAGWPPDTHGDVGPTNYIQAVNTSIGIFNKSTGARLSAFTFNSFFAANGGSGVCATGNQGDPYVIYDQVSGRWIISDFAWSNIMSGPYYECIAVSKTGDPLSGGWWLYSFVAESGAGASLNDYPKLGIWADGIYMSANRFDCTTSNCSSANYTGVKVWALNRDDMISGASLRSISFLLGNSYFSLLPANLKGTPPPANTPEYFMSDSGSNTSMKLWKFSANWATPASSTMTGPTSFAVASFSRPSSKVPQRKPNLTTIVDSLDTLGDRLMSSLQYRNIGGIQSLWVSRTVVAGTSMGVRWMEVRNMSTTPAVFQQGTYAPDSNYRFMPSLAVDKSGNMAIGYSVSSSSVYPSIRYAGRLVSDTLGILGQTEASFVAGTGSQKGGGSRWGDYASMSVDPVDDCTFWFTTEYYETTNNNWQTRIGSFKFPSCGGVVGPTATPSPTNTPAPTYTPTPTVTPGGSTNIIVNPGFESGPGSGWTENSSGGYGLIDTNKPHTGSYSAYLCDYNSCKEYVQQTITVPSNATLTYWWYMTSSDSLSLGYDSLKVQVYSTGGTLLATLRTRTNTATRNSWQMDTLSLSAFAGQTVMLRFTTSTNIVYKTAFWIDDVSVK